MLILTLLAGSAALSIGCTVALVACSVDTYRCHRRSRLVGPTRAVRAAR